MCMVIHARLVYVYYAYNKVIQIISFYYMFKSCLGPGSLNNFVVHDRSSSSFQRDPDTCVIIIIIADKLVMFLILWACGSDMNVKTNSDIKKKNVKNLSF